MKLKLWVQIILIIISLVSGMMMMYDIEITMVPFIIGFITLSITTYTLSKYGTLEEKIKAKLEEFMSR